MRTNVIKISSVLITILISIALVLQFPSQWGSTSHVNMVNINDFFKMKGISSRINEYRSKFQFQCPYFDIANASSKLMSSFSALQISLDANKKHQDQVSTTLREFNKSPFGVATRQFVKKIDDFGLLCYERGFIFSWNYYVSLRVYAYARLMPQLKYFVYICHRYYVPEIYGLISDNFSKIMSVFVRFFVSVQKWLVASTWRVFCVFIDHSSYHLSQAMAPYWHKIQSTESYEIVYSPIVFYKHFLHGSVVYLGNQMSPYTLEVGNLIAEKIIFFFQHIVNLCGHYFQILMVQIRFIFAQNLTTPIEITLKDLRDDFYNFLLAKPSDEEINRLLGLLIVQKKPKPITSLTTHKERDNIIDLVLSEFRLFKQSTSERKIISWESIVFDICGAVVEDFVLEYKTMHQRFIEQAFIPTIDAELERLDKEFDASFESLADKQSFPVYITNEGLAVLTDDGGMQSLNKTSCYIGCYQIFQCVYNNTDSLGYSLECYHDLIKQMDKFEKQKHVEEQLISEYGFIEAQKQIIIQFKSLAEPPPKLLKMVYVNRHGVLCKDQSDEEFAKASEASKLELLSKVDALDRLINQGLDIVASQFNNIKFTNLDMIETFAEIVLTNWKKQLLASFEHSAQQDIFVENIEFLIELLQNKKVEAPSETLGLVVAELKRTEKVVQKESSNWQALKNFHRIKKHFVVTRHILNDHRPDLELVYEVVESYWTKIERRREKAERMCG